MQTTPNYQLNQPDPADFYNIADFNENAAIVDGALADLAGRLTVLQERLQNVRVTIDIHDFADMAVISPAEQDVWRNAGVTYSIGDGSWHLHAEIVSILAELNTGDTYGVLRPMYRPAQTITGTAVIAAGSDQNRACTCQILPDGSLVIAPDQPPGTPILTIQSLSVSYAGKEE